jgi:predicted secreted protein with PEFG-CTERM motif
MNTRTSYVAIAILAAVLTTSTIQLAEGAFSEEACPDCPGGTGGTSQNRQMNKDIPLRMWTDSATYDHKSKINVQGQVANIKQGTEIGLVVIGPPPFNNIVAIAQIPVASDGTFKTTLSTAGASMKYDGTYTIKVTYGNQNINNKALVELTGGIAGIGSGCGPGELSASKVCIPYTITSGSVSGAMFSAASNSLTVQISSLSDGKLTINPPTTAIRGIFMVLVDGEEWDDVVINGNKVVVDFPAGTNEIEIIGTFAIPEFGTIAALILAVAIISIIVVSSRTRLMVLPKY